MGMKLHWKGSKGTQKLLLQMAAREGGSKMSQQGKVFAVKPEDLSLIPGVDPHGGEVGGEKKQPPQLVL